MGWTPAPLDPPVGDAWEAACSIHYDHGCRFHRWRESERSEPWPVSHRTPLPSTCVPHLCGWAVGVDCGAVQCFVFS